MLSLPMWFSKPIDLARHLVRAPADLPPEPSLPEPPPDELDAPEPVSNFQLALSRRELDRFAAALLATLGTVDGRLDTPARLAAAIDILIDEIDGHGRSRVVRRPAGLTSPEAWEVAVDAGCQTTRSALDALVRGLPLRVGPADGLA